MMSPENQPQSELSLVQRIARIAGGAVLGGLIGVGLIEGIAQVVPHHHVAEANRIDADLTFGALGAVIGAVEADKRNKRHPPH